MRRVLSLLFLLVIASLMISIVSADTVILYANNGADLSQTATSEDWSTLVGGVGSTATDLTTYPYLIQTSSHTTTAGKYIRVFRGGITFVKPNLEGSPTIDSATVRILYYGKTTTLGGTNEVALVIGNPADPTDFVAGDYNELTLSTDSEVATRINFTSLTGNINFTLNAAGRTALADGAGYLTFYTLDADELDGTFSGVWDVSKSRTLRAYNYTHATESSKTYIQYTYIPAAGGDTTPPASITNLGNTTTCNSINWTWDDSVSDDADIVQIWQNNTFLHNVSANQTYDLWEDLAELTEYTFSSHTCDLTGNCNTTWVNLSSTTGSCTTPTPTPTPTPTLSGDVGFEGYAHFNFTAWNLTEMDDWNWSVNSIYVGNGTDPFFDTWLLWGQIHNVTLTISNATNNYTISQMYNLHNITPTIIPTPTSWIPDINPSTEVDYNPETLWGYWWIGAGILLIWLVFKK